MPGWSGTSTRWRCIAHVLETVSSFSDRGTAQRTTTAQHGEHGVDHPGRAAQVGRAVGEANGVVTEVIGDVPPRPSPPRALGLSREHRHEGEPPAPPLLERGDGVEGIKVPLRRSHWWAGFAS